MRISDWSSDVCSSDLVGREAGHPHAPVVLDRKQLRDRGEATLRNRVDLAEFGLRHLPGGPLAILEASRSLALDTTAIAFGGYFGVPFVAAVAEVVDAAQVGQHLEAELVAQRAAAVVPGVGRDHDAHLAPRREIGRDPV